MKKRNLKKLSLQDISWFTQWLEKLEGHLRAAGKELKAAEKEAAKIKQKWMKK